MLGSVIEVGMSSSGDRYSTLVAAVADSVFGGPGHLAPGTRAAIREHATRAAAGTAGAPAESGVPETWAAYADAVVRRAYTVTDEDVRRLTAAGRTDDEVFEASVAAAVGAGVARLERALSLLKGGR
jgi:hypothetical protein